MIMNCMNKDRAIEFDFSRNSLSDEKDKVRKYMLECDLNEYLNIGT